ncbi:MAG: Ku protein [Rubrivivax sp.]
MAARSLASLTLSFGLVSIPVKLYSATEAAASVRFNLLDPDGARVKQQYVSEKTGKVIERSQLVKGYEFEKDRFVLFSADELKALDEAATHSIDIVAFVPETSVDPIFYDRAYYLAPDKRGGKPYALLLEAMRASGRCALARWSTRGKQHVVQVRPAEDGLVLQQLLYAAEVRSQKELHIEPVDVSKAELQLALQLIEQIAQDAYDPAAFDDEERKRTLAAIDRKIAGKQVVAATREEQPGADSAQVIDLMEALRASLGGKSARGGAKAPAAKADAGADAAPAKSARKPARRVAAKPADDAADAPAPKVRARK